MFHRILRKTPVVLGALIALVLCAAPALGSPPNPERLQPSADERERLDAGEVIARASRGDLIRMDVAAVVDAPLDAVWDVVWDFGSSSQWVPDMLESTVIERGSDWFVADAVTGLPFPLRDRVYRLRVQRASVPEPLRASHWENVPGHGNINVMRGFWILEPWNDDPNRTLVRQVTLADFNIAIPDGLVTRGARRELPATIRALRRRVAARSR